MKSASTRRGGPSRLRLWAITAAVTALLAFPLVAHASDADVAVVDVTAPTNSVDLAPGGSDAITIDISVTGNQAGTATFKVYRDWELTGGSFVGSNPQQFTVDPRSPSDPADTFSTTGTVTVAAGHATGSFLLEVGVFDISNSNATGAKLAARESSNYTINVIASSDTTPPTITITTPPSGATYLLNQVVNADYSCSDEAGGSGLKSCVGTVANGAAIDTSTVGPKSFTVDAEDNAGNTATLTHNYTVAYAVCVLYDESKPHKLGSTVPIKLQLCDAGGVNYSSSSIIVNLTNLSKVTNGVSAEPAEDSGNPNPDNNFRYSADLGGDGGYIFNLSTKGLSSGTWKVHFTASGGNYSVEFQIK